MEKKASQYDLTRHIHDHVNVDNSGLNGSEQLVLLSLSMHLNSATLLCNPSKATLANRCCLSERTVDAAVSGLVSKGYILYDKGCLIGKLRKPNSYTFVYEKIYGCTKTPWRASDAPVNAVPARPVPEPVAVIVQEPEPIAAGNPDGSSRFHSNGTRCHSFDDHKRAALKVVQDCEDFPW